MDKEILIDDLRNCNDGEKARALATVIQAETEKETESMRLETQTKLSKKERIVNIFKIIGTVLLGVLTCGATIFGQRQIMKFEETGTIRTKAWTGVKPDKISEIR